MWGGFLSLLLCPSALIGTRALHAANDDSDEPEKFPKWTEEEGAVLDWEGSGVLYPSDSPDAVWKTELIASVHVDACVTASGENLTDRLGFFKCASGCDGKRLFWSKNSFITVMQGDTRSFAMQNEDQKKDNPGGLDPHMVTKGNTMFAHMLNMARDMCDHAGYCVYFDWCDQLNNHYNNKWVTENSEEVVAEGWDKSDEGRRHKSKINLGLSLAVGYADVFVDTRENQGVFCAQEREAAMEYLDDPHYENSVVTISFEDVVQGSTGAKGTKGYGIPPSFKSYPVTNVSKFIVGAIADCNRTCQAGPSTLGIEPAAHQSSPGNERAACGPLPKFDKFGNERSGSTPRFNCRYSIAPVEDDF